MASLPPCLLNAWQLCRKDEQDAVVEEQLRGWTTSSLAQAYMRYQLDRRIAGSDVQTLSHNSPSLSSVAVGNILRALERSEDLYKDLNTIAESLPSTIFRILLNDQRIPYQVLRAFSRLPQFTTTTESGSRTVVDIDEAVLQNERYIRRLRDLDERNKYIVSLEDLCGTLSNISDNATSVIFDREDPPKGGLEALDAYRRTRLEIQSTNADISDTLEKATNGILHGLDWSNVIVAGSLVLTALLKWNSTFPNPNVACREDIKLYIYGLDPNEANLKVNEIHDTWADNIKSDAKKLIVKNAKTIDLVTEYPARPVRIVLKLYSSPIDVLLDSDLDAGAIGFDGCHVTMLPQCARAIETGYSIFTVDHVWGHHCQGRRVSNVSRLFLYAGYGFGIRFLPSSAQSLVENTIKSKVSRDISSLDRMTGGADEEMQQEDLETTHENRELCGKEPDLKVLKTVAQCAADFVHHIYMKSPKEGMASYRFEEEGGNGILEPLQDGSFETTHISLGDLDNLENKRGGLQDGRGFEILMRYCEVWRLFADGKAMFDMSDAAATSIFGRYNVDHDCPEYELNETMELGSLADRLTDYSTSLWARTKAVICWKLGIPLRAGGFGDYSTRMVRRIVLGPDLASVQEKQITTPVVVPLELEDYLLKTLPQQYDVPSHFVDFKALIPVHDASKYEPSITGIPSLRDTAAESGNLRYWVITNQRMWANQNLVLDEFAELMWCMFDPFKHTTMDIMPPGADDPRCTWRLAEYLRHRIILPNLSGD